MQPTPQDNQLMSEHRVLSFKPQLRLEGRGQDGQSETEQSDHSASLGDSITSSTQIRFSVHTKGPGADSEEKREPVSDIDIALMDSLKALDLKWPIREADIVRPPQHVRKCQERTISRYQRHVRVASANERSAISSYGAR